MMHYWWYTAGTHCYCAEVIIASMVFPPGVMTVQASCFVVVLSAISKLFAGNLQAKYSVCTCCRRWLRSSWLSGMVWIAVSAGGTHACCFLLRERATLDATTHSLQTDSSMQHTSCGLMAGQLFIRIVCAAALLQHVASCCVVRPSVSSSGDTLLCHPLRTRGLLDLGCCRNWLPHR